MIKIKYFAWIKDITKSEYENSDTFHKMYIQPVEEFSKDKGSFPNRIRFLFMDCAEKKKWLE